MKIKNVDLGKAFDKFKYQLDTVTNAKKETGENYAPQNHASNVNCDIAGGLHELLHRYRS